MIVGLVPFKMISTRSGKPAHPAPVIRREKLTVQSWLLMELFIASDTCGYECPHRSLPQKEAQGCDDASQQESSPSTHELAEVCVLPKAFSTPSCGMRICIRGAYHRLRCSLRDRAD